jgi:uncharacterized membrane protein
MLGLAVAGIALGAYLTWVAVDAEAEAFCAGGGNCAAVQDSRYAEVLGVPVAALGLGMYLGLAALLVARRRLQGDRGLVLGAWTFALAFAGALYSAYLTWLEFAVIGAICPWCVVSAAIVAAICVLAWPDLRAARTRLEARERG